MDISGVTSTKANSILDQSVVGGSVNGAGHLILTKHDGTTIDGGDFTAIVSGILNQSVSDGVAAQLPAAITGKFVAKGNLSGAVSFTEFTKDTLPNALITATLTGNITISSADFPANPRPNTQFVMRFTQDATGGRTLTLSGIKKSMGALDLSTAAGAIDMIVFMYDGTNWFAGAMGLSFS